MSSVADFGFRKARGTRKSAIARTSRTVETPPPRKITGGLEATSCRAADRIARFPLSGARLRPSRADAVRRRTLRHTALRVLGACATLEPACARTRFHPLEADWKSDKALPRTSRSDGPIAYSSGTPVGCWRRDFGLSSWQCPSPLLDESWHEISHEAWH